MANKATDDPTSVCSGPPTAVLTCPQSFTCPAGRYTTVDIERLARKVTALPLHQFMPFYDAFVLVKDQLRSNLLAAIDLTRHLQAGRLTVAVRVIWLDGSEQVFILRRKFWRWYGVFVHSSQPDSGFVDRAHDNPVRLVGRWHFFIGRRRFGRLYSTTPPSKPTPSKPAAQESPQEQPEIPQWDTQSPTSEASKKITVDSWVFSAVEKYPRKKDEKDYAGRLKSHAPRAWTKKTIQNALARLTTQKNNLARPTKRIPKRH